MDNVSHFGAPTDESFNSTGSDDVLLAVSFTPSKLLAKFKTGISSDS